MMKHILALAALILISVSSYGQGIYNKQATNIKQNRMIVDSVLGVPRDTTPTNNATYLGAPVGDSGRIAYKNGFFYGKDGVSWKVLGSGAIDTTSLSNRIGDKLSISEGTAVRISMFGAISDTTIDQSNILDSAITYCAINGIKYLNVDRSIKANDTIGYNKNKVLLVGDSVIYSNNTYDFGEKKIGGYSFFTGSINTKYNSFRASSGKLQNKDTVKIVVWGNSVSMGYDWYSYSPSLVNFTSINQPIAANSWYDNFVKQIAINYPNQPIIIYNRSAPGYGMIHYNNSLTTFINGAVDRFKTPQNQDSTWIDVIRDLRADMIILSLGMNDGNEFIRYAQSALDSIALWPKVPDIVLMSTPSPNYVTTYGGSYRISKLNIANQQRFISARNKYYMIDVARIHDAKRYGIDYSAYVFTQASKIVSSLSGSTYYSDRDSLVFNTSSGSGILRSTLDHGGFYSFRFKFTSSFDSVTVTRGMSIAKVTSTSIELHPAYFTGYDLGKVSKSFSFYPNVEYNIKIEIGARGMIIYINDTVRSQTNVPAVSAIGNDNINVSGNTGIISLYQFNVFGPIYKKYAPSLTGSDMWGVNSMDGNAINHPTKKGLNETYNEAVKEFVADLFNRSTSDSNYILNQGAFYQTARIRITGNVVADSYVGKYLAPGTSAGILELFGGTNSPSGSTGALIELRGGTFSPSPGEIVFRTGTGVGVVQPERARIDINGRLGVGTSTPSHTLHAVGSIRSTDSLNAGGSVNWGYGSDGGARVAALRWNQRGNTYTPSGATNSNSTSGARSSGWWTNGLGSGTSSTNGYIIEYDGYNVLALQNGNGRFAIGTETPASKIHVNGSVSIKQRTVTGNTTIGDDFLLIVNNTGTATITLPPAASVPDRIYAIKKISASLNNVDIDANGSELIDGLTIRSLVNQWSCIWIQSNGTGWSVIAGHVNGTLY